ncbi:MAG: hypothetical protein KatS3mg130_0059 [Candidatus Sumerlaea sp.]|uniref:Prepilin-type N-terminal cleavage/methylation domain-containing protein n=1 Tax=Sumerlaea chitinivorans TaxID=2250252 RepID=A0A2Z4Y8A3_SUMC1|nr:hypothetical protein BRCON_2745 [Candidatus Sumerlaea chitinivorans]GIX43651.1 MAG: hypothetical protein KatS3mg130_0059 [Candidatus Sumerlaea sp.]
MQYPRTTKMSRGFTLIELLIVVAIIAILAAIAVPNFLEAQTRSKVARVKSDMRSLASALEAYAVDNNNKYPPEHLYPPLAPVPYNESVRVMMAEAHLTTPVSYISTIPLDPFKSKPQWAPGLYWYYNWLERYGRMLNPNRDSSYPGTCPWYDAPTAWILTSLGPDQTAQWPIPYDPTNGTVSTGDIARLGPGGNPRS